MSQSNKVSIREDAIAFLKNVIARMKSREVLGPLCDENIADLVTLLKSERRKTMLEIADFFENEYDGPSDQLREMVALQDRLQSAKECDRE